MVTLSGAGCRRILKLTPRGTGNPLTGGVALRPRLGYLTPEAIPDRAVAVAASWRPGGTVRPRSGFSGRIRSVACRGNDTSSGAPSISASTRHANARATIWAWPASRVVRRWYRPRTPGPAPGTPTWAVWKHYPHKVINVILAGMSYMSYVANLTRRYHWK